MAVGKVEDLGWGDPEVEDVAILNWNEVDEPRLGVALANVILSHIKKKKTLPLIEFDQCSGAR